MGVVKEYPAKQILVATDFSDSAEGALGVATKYARAFHARLHLLHVFAGAEVDVTQLLADAAAKAGPDVPVTIAGTRGTPPRKSCGTPYVTPSTSSSWAPTGGPA